MNGFAQDATLAAAYYSAIPLKPTAGLNGVPGFAEDEGNCSSFPFAMLRVGMTDLGT